MSGIPSAEVSPDPIFRPFTWHNVDVPPSYLKTLAEHTHDIGNGIATLLAPIEFHESGALDNAPLLSAVDKVGFDIFRCQDVAVNWPASEYGWSLHESILVAMSSLLYPDRVAWNFLQDGLNAHVPREETN
jgi:hypothetical protein